MNESTDSSDEQHSIRLRWGLIWEIGVYWIAGVALVLGLAVATMSLQTFTESENSQRERVSVLLLDLREKIETDLRVGFEFQDDPNIQGWLEALLIDSTKLQAVEAFDLRGTSLYNTDRGSIGDAVPQEWLSASRRLYSGRWIEADDRETVLGVPVRDGLGETAGYLAASYSTRQPGDIDRAKSLFTTNIAIAFVALALACYGLYRLIMRPALSSPGGENRRGPERTSGKEPGWGILYDAADRVSQALLKLQPEEKKEQQDRAKPTSRVIG